MPTWIERFLPPNPVARLLSFQSILFAMGTTGWLLIAGIVVIGGIGIHPAARAAERYLATRTATAADQPA